MSPSERSEINAMAASGRFTVKEIAYACGPSEWEVAAYLVRSGRIARRATIAPHTHTKDTPA